MRCWFRCRLHCAALHVDTFMGREVQETVGRQTIHVNTSTSSIMYESTHSSVTIAYGTGTGAGGRRARQRQSPRSDEVSHQVNK